MRPRQLKLKVCGLREARCINAVAALAPDYMGFIFAQGSPRRAEATLIREPIRAVPRSITTVGVFRDQELTEVCAVVRTLELQAVQLHGDEDVGYLRALKQNVPGISIIRAVQVQCEEDVADVKDQVGEVDLYLLDSGRGGTGVPFNWLWLSRYSATTPFLLAGGLGVDNALQALKEVSQVEKCVGFDINSRVELEPGVKDTDKIRAFQREIGL